MLPFNIASYALLLTIIAKEVNMVPEELVGNLGDTHLYLNHIEQAKEQIGRDFYELPTLKINPNNEMRLGGGIFTYVNTDFTLENYKCHPVIKAPLSN
jgi:thymidylate synthase